MLNSDFIFHTGGLETIRKRRKLKAKMRKLTFLKIFEIKNEVQLQAATTFCTGFTQIKTETENNV